MLLIETITVFLSLINGSKRNQFGFIYNKEKQENKNMSQS